MDSIDDAVRELTKDIGKVLRTRGFKGSGGKWRYTSPDGLVLVHRWTAQVPDDRGTVKRIGLTGEVVPAEWWRYTAWKDARDRHPVTPIERTAGPRIIDHVYDDSRPACVWSIRLHPHYWGRPDTLDDDVAAIGEEMPGAVDALARAMIELLTGDRYAEAIIADGRMDVREWFAVAVLLAGNGSTRGLDHALRELTVLLSDPSDQWLLDEITAYTDDRLAGRA
ncbi:hypothetical protein Afil01_46910 [Actinorhabdospora filicis]|uniref:DUF4304 domain-containing protein n=1 Tax=Actinorhabdospora filicis TaxID=1785913 RepID=A0A9W6SPZ5_9ACTN|nr:hypothetical protein [Actinorhabdospora filicis]GLZ79884.1 hypothetical protein Afil01_46910 [Actinorhabdospora filicis]